MEESLGKKLIAARRANGITIDDAVYLAKIPRDVVIALESENFGFFSSPLYARSFLKQYSSYVDANVEPWIDDLVPISLIDGESLGSYIDISEPLNSSRPKQKSRAMNSSPNNGAMSAVWVLLLTIALIYGGIKAYQKIEAISNQAESAENQPPSEKSKAEAKVEAKPKAEVEVATSQKEEPPAETATSEKATKVIVKEPRQEGPRRAIVVKEE